MSINEKDVVRIAKLARLQLDSKQTKEYAKELSSILDFVSQLNELDLAKVPETAQVTGIVNALRSDKVQSGLAREKFLAGVPAEKDKQLKVKGVF